MLSITGTIIIIRNTRRETIKEVASVVGVSTQTVSRVINQRPDISPETRTRVQDAIERLNYQPSALARSLIRQRSLTLGVVTAGLKYLGPSRTLSGITRAEEGAGYSLLLKELPNFNLNNVSPIFQILISHHVDGIVWAATEETIAMMAPTEGPTPLVAITSFIPMASAITGVLFRWISIRPPHGQPC